jgi:hypothetical protein
VIDGRRLLPLWLALLLDGALLAQQPELAPANEPDLTSKAAAKVGIDRALGWLVSNQLNDGAFCHGVCESQFEYGFSPATFHAWQTAAHGLATMALLVCEETPERRAALDRGVRWLLKTGMPLRGSNWDNDAVWAWLYGTVTMTAIADDPRFQGDDWKGPVAQRGREFVSWLEKNQVPAGGFGYYDDPTFSQRPKWATSFATSSVLPALAMAMNFGWVKDQQMLERAAQYLKRCRLPNGAYEYDLNPVPRLTGGANINDVKGSLGRIQACNWALRAAKDPDITDDVIRTGLRQFFDHHEFLQIARMRPIPHEAFYQNAGYFFYFGHFYCSQAINLLPAAEREAFHAQLRPHLLRTQRADGSCNDFQHASYMITSSTSFLAMALQAGL